MHHNCIPFSDFAPDCDSNPLVVDHNPSVNFDFEENFGYLNMGILTLDPVLDICIFSPPSTIASKDTCEHSFPNIVSLDDYLANIACLFVELYFTLKRHYS